MEETSTCRRNASLLRRGITLVIAAVAAVVVSFGAVIPAAADPINDLNNWSECKGLQEGATGSCVVALQEALNAAGYPVVVDGFWGPATDGAVRLLQRHYNKQASGVLNEETIYLLGAAGDREKTEQNILQHKDGWGKKVCNFFGPLGPTCDDLMSPEPAG